MGVIPAQEHADNTLHQLFPRYGGYSNLETDEKMIITLFPRFGGYSINSSGYTLTVLSCFPVMGVILINTPISNISKKVVSPLWGGVIPNKSTL